MSRRIKSFEHLTDQLSQRAKLKIDRVEPSGVLLLSALHGAQVFMKFLDVVIDTEREPARFCVVDGELAYPAAEVIVVGCHGVGSISCKPRVYDARQGGEKFYLEHGQLALAGGTVG